MTLPNGVTMSYSYDGASELAGLTYSLGQTTLGNLTYSYDPLGRRAGVGGSFARTGLPLAVNQTAYNADNQLTTWGTANLFYDTNGNMISDETHSYTWDARNRLQQIDLGNTASFTYDPFGRRATKSILGTSTTFLYDGANAVQEVIGGTNTANSLSGGIDEVFQRTDSSGARSFLADPLGSTLALTDSAGALQTQYTFEPFGNTTATGAATTNSFAFTGRELDSTGLYFFRARYYNSQLQRFISEDPAQAGDNFYVYAGDDPINWNDPYGLDWLNNLADFSAAAGSNLSSGITLLTTGGLIDIGTDQINDLTGASSMVNRCSGWYTAGTVAGIAVSTGIGGAAGLEEGLTKEGGEFAANQWSHWLPDRWRQAKGGPLPDFIVDSKLNGRYMSKIDHIFNDPKAYNFFPKSLKDDFRINPAWLRQWNRIPPWIKGAAAGGAIAGRKKGGCS